MLQDVPRKLKEVGNPYVLVYPEGKIQNPSESPSTLYFPRKEIMLKMMRACIGVKSPQELWFNNDTSEGVKDYGIDWGEMAAKLPASLSDPSEIKARERLWIELDENRNGHISLSEVLNGFENILPPEATPAIKAAFHFAKAYIKTDLKSNEFVEPAEFRYFLVALKMRFEYLMAFQRIDKNSDGKITIKEFLQARPEIERWIGYMADPEQEFRSIDVN